MVLSVDRFLQLTLWHERAFDASHQSSSMQSNSITLAVNDIIVVYDNVENFYVYLYNSLTSVEQQVVISDIYTHTRERR